MNFNFDDLFPKAASGIHIKPENRGKFTASANKANMGVQEYASHVLANRDKYNSTQIKRAVFAKNASKWNKGEAGLPIPQSQLPFFQSHYNEGYIIPEIDYPLGANVEPEPFNSNLKPYIMDDGPRPYTANNYQSPSYNQQPINTELALGQQNSPQAPQGRRGINGAAISQGILGALGAVSSVLPDKAKKFQPIQPKRTYNPFAQGTGSQAIMDQGGIIPTDDDNFWPYQEGGDPIKGQKAQMLPPSSDRSRNKANTAELLSYFASLGANPTKTEGGSYLLDQASMAYDQNVARDLYTSMIQFSNRPDVQTMNTDERLKTYYELMAKHGKLGGTVSELRNIGYDPMAQIKKSPDKVLATLSPEYLEPIKPKGRITKNKAGGKVK